MEDQSAPIPEEITSELGRIIFISQLVGSWLRESQNPWLRSFSSTSFHDAEAPRAPCRRSGNPPRFSWEGKLELTEALRRWSQPREFQKVSTQENPEGSLKPALFMKVRCESVQTRSETGTRSREVRRHTRAVCRRAERRDCPSQPRIRACSRSFMNNAG